MLTDGGEGCGEEDHSHEGHGFHCFAVGFGCAADVEHDFAVALGDSVVGLCTFSLASRTVHCVLVPVGLEYLQA
jgi:hypothetical protein